MATEEEFLKNLGEKIKQKRKQRGHSLDSLAEHSGFEKARLSRLEAGKVNITVKTLFKLSKALDAPVRDFFT